ncbi:MAG TPA: hypothetical protein VID04_03925 [Methylomirabilota bacterium]|jgi:hypothetical protein
MTWRVLAIAVVFAFGGCGTTLPYKPEQQPPGVKVSAGYRIVGDRLGVEIDTDGRRLEEAKILRPDGSELHAQTIEHAPPTYSPGMSVGFGVGTATGGGHSGTAIGTGVGVGFPVGGGSSRVQGSTYAFFPLSQVGPAPYRLLVKLEGTGPAVIVLGGTPPDQK